MSRVLYIAGPTASGKSELAAAVAGRVDSEIVSADAFQIYQGFDVLSGKPDPVTLQKVPHHLIGVVSAEEEMNAARFRWLALPIISQISSRGKLPLVVGGSGLYIKALTDGLADIPATDPQLRQELKAMNLEQLRHRLSELDPEALERVDTKNRRRLVRAIEICVSTGSPGSAERTQWKEHESFQTHSRSSPAEKAAAREAHQITPSSDDHSASGVFIFRDREELYQRINQRVQTMLENGAIEDVRHSPNISSTVAQMIGIAEIRRFLNGEISLTECTEMIQQSTRRYAKRQLTWFRRKSNFESLNLSLLSHNEAVEWVTRRANAAAHGE